MNPAGMNAGSFSSMNCCTWGDLKTSMKAFSRRSSFFLRLGGEAQHEAIVDGAVDDQRGLGIAARREQVGDVDQRERDGRGAGSRMRCAVIEMRASLPTLPKFIRSSMRSLLPRRWHTPRRAVAPAHAPAVSGGHLTARPRLCGPACGSYIPHRPDQADPGPRGARYLGRGEGVR